MTLTATPVLNWVFDYWEGALSGSTNPTSLLVDADLALTAVFRPEGDRMIRGIVTNSITGNPVEGAYIEVAAGLTKALDYATTDVNGAYILTVPEDTGAVDLTISCREYFPQDENFDQPPQTWNPVLVPLGITTPSGVDARSDAKSVRIRWEANPEYNAKGYYLWRTLTDAAGNPGANEAVQVSDLLATPEFVDTDTEPGQFYIYQAQALSGADRPSALSDASAPVKAQYLTIATEDVTTHTDFENTFLWDLTPESINEALSGLPPGDRDLDL